MARRSDWPNPTTPADQQGKQDQGSEPRGGAGEGNRTLTASLGSTLGQLPMGWSYSSEGMGMNRGCPWMTAADRCVGQIRGTAGKGEYGSGLAAMAPPCLGRFASRYGGHGAPRLRSEAAPRRHRGEARACR